MSSKIIPGEMILENSIPNGQLINAPSGADTQIQFNDNGAFGGDATFTFNKTTKVVDMDALTITGTPAIGLDISGGTFATANINLAANPIIMAAGVPIVKFNLTNHNTFLGSQAAWQSSGVDNVFVGHEAGRKNDDSTGSGKKNIYIGYQAGYGAVSTNKGQLNVAIGYQALFSNTVGSSNVAIGNEALLNNEGGSSNFALGAVALKFNTSGVNNMAIGYFALGSNTTGGYNIAIGAEALRNTVSVDRNIAIGYQALRNAGKWNTAIGYQAGYVGADKQYGVFIGYSAGYNCNADGCVSIGFQAGLSASGEKCINIGWAGGKNNTSANRLIIGNQLYANEATEITNSILYGVMAATPAAQSLNINVGTLGVTGSISSGTLTVTTGAYDALDITGVNTVFLDCSGGAITIGGFVGGVDGQVLYIAKLCASANALTLEHIEGTGNQDIYLHAGADETLFTEYGGWVLICNGTNWFDTSHSKHV